MKIKGSGSSRMFWRIKQREESSCLSWQTGSEGPGVGCLAASSRERPV